MPLKARNINVICIGQGLNKSLTKIQMIMFIRTIIIVIIIIA